MCVCDPGPGNGEGTGPHDTLLTDTRRRVVSLTENTVRMSGVELRTEEPVCVCDRGTWVWGGCVRAYYSPDRYTKKSHQSP